MSKFKKVPVQFGDGCAVDDDIAYLSAFPDALHPDVSFTRMFAFNATTENKWFHHDLNGHRVVSVCLRRAREGTSRAVCALSEEGAVELANTAGQTFETIPGPGLGSNSRRLGCMQRIKEIGTHLYACGAGNQIYRRDPDGWRPIDHALVGEARSAMDDFVDWVMKSDGQPAGGISSGLSPLSQFGVLADVGGTDENDLYACGLGGALWHWDGAVWQRLDSGVEHHLHSIHAVSEDEVWICGHNGTLLTGNKKDGFRVLFDPEICENFWSVRKFAGKVYLGTASGLISLTRGAMMRVQIPGPTRHPFIQALDSTDKTLWVFADRFLVRLQSARWERIDHPDNI